MRTERVTVTMPAEQAEQLRAVASGRGGSVSAYVSQAVRDRLDRDAALDKLAEHFGGPPADTPEWRAAVAWARQTLGVNDAGAVGR